MLERAEKPSLGLLEKSVTEFREKPHTPELVTGFWQTFLEASIKTQGLDIPVSTIACDRTQKELEVLKKEGRMWVPETRLTYSQLDRIFPKMGDYTYSLKDSPIKDEFEQDSQGVDVEVSIDSPNRNIEEEDIKKLFESQGRKGMRLKTYIKASQASKVLTGHYFDEEKNSVSGLLGFRSGGSVASVAFSDGGRLFVHLNLYPRDRPSWGGYGWRSEGVKKA